MTHHFYRENLYLHNFTDLITSMSEHVHFFED